MMNMLMAPRKLPSYFAVEEAAEPLANSPAAPRPRPATPEGRPALADPRSTAAQPHGAGALPASRA